MVWQNVFLGLVYLFYEGFLLDYSWGPSNIHDTSICF